MQVQTKTYNKKPRIVVYLDGSTIDLLDQAKKPRSVKVREIIETYFNIESVDPLSYAIRGLAEKHYKDVAHELINIHKPVANTENVITIPQSLTDGVKKYGYDDARQFIDHAIKHYANSLDNK